MQYDFFGDTDLEVSRICFGTWAYGGDWGSFDRDDALAAIRRARAVGINFFDTAQAYGFGTAEELLGEALREEIADRREELVIATKGGLRMDDGELQRDAGRDWLRQGIEESLEHLGTDYVDLYQVHWPDPDTPARETAAALGEFVDEGLTRYVGVSNYDVEEMEAFREYEELASMKGCTVAQLAVAWTLSHPAVDCPIVGARNPEQIEETARSVEVELEPEDLQEIDRILEDAVPVGGPAPEAV